MMVPIALRVAARLAQESLDVEVIDPRSVSPLDEETICESVRKTRKLVVADPGWQSAGLAAEIIALVCERLGPWLAAEPARVCLPDSHAPMSAALEEAYYPDDASLTDVVRGQFRKRQRAAS
jgi:pyruvate dehydrogenase E1 component beta subunit